MPIVILWLTVTITITIGHFTVVCLVNWPARLEVSLLRYLSLLFSFQCQLVSIRIWFTQQKQWGLYQNKVTFSLAAIQRPDHWTNNCKMAYSIFVAENNDSVQIRQVRLGLLRFGTSHKKEWEIVDNQRQGKYRFIVMYCSNRGAFRCRNVSL